MQFILDITLWNQVSVLCRGEEIVFVTAVGTIKVL